MSEKNIKNIKKLRIGRRPKKAELNLEADSNEVIHIGEKAIILKSEYKNINKVFNLKGVNAKFRTYISAMEQKTKDRYIKSKKWVLADKARTKFFKTGIITALIVVNIILMLSGLSVKYNVYVNNKYIGVLNGKNEFSDLLNQANAKMNKESNSEVVFIAKTDFKPTIALKSSKVDSAAVLHNLANNSFFSKKGCAIIVDREEIVVLPTRAMAQELLDKLKQPYKESEKTVVDFVETVEIKDKDIDNMKMPTFEEAFKLLSAGKEGSKIYKVQKGDTLWLIAKNNSISVSKIKEINPGLGENIKEGQEIKLSSPVPLINVKTKEITTLEQTIPFNTIQQKDEKSYSGSKKIISKGVNGLKQSLVEVVKENGRVVSVNPISEKIVKVPVAQKEKVGTQKIPAKAVTGTFKRPTFGFITSRFGARWGRQHEGIDIAAKVGDPIYAADGGVVSFAGVEGGYGKLVKINHGNKYTTYYGHCKEILVKKGQKVYKGQKIALVGMTGRTTGPHLHFEIRENGNPVNPKKLLN